MHISKARMLIKPVLFALIFILFLSIINFVFVPSNIFTRLMMNELYHQSEPIDIFFVGASRFYRGINPEVIDEQLDMNSFNAGSSGQGIVDGYYIVKEMYKEHSPKVVVFDMNWKKFGARETIKQSELIFDYFKMSPDKLLYLRDAFAADEYLRALVPGLQYADGETSLNGSGLINNIKNKLSPEYTNYDYSSAAYRDEWYAGKGFVYSTIAFKERNFGELELPTSWAEGHAWDAERVDDEMLAYFEKTIQLCKDNGSAVILLGMPNPNAVMKVIGNYDGYHEYVMDFAAKNEVDFYNFELVKSDVFEKKDEYFYDSVHLNGEGANVFSVHLAQFLLDYLGGTVNEDKYLYKSCDELMDSASDVFNTWMEMDVASGTLQAFAYAGTNVTPEFEFSYKAKEDEAYTVFRPYDEDPSVQMPELNAGSYRIRVNARARGADVDFEQYDEMLQVIE